MLAKMSLPSLLLVAALGIKSTVSAYDFTVWRDAPISSRYRQYLDTNSGFNWTVARWDGILTIPAQVPGDLLTDLAAGGVIADPIFELTFLDGVWDDGNWTYSTSFALDAAVVALITAGQSADVSLVFESIKMVADISLNGVYLGFTADQFLRYAFPVQHLLNTSDVNTLSVTMNVGSDPRLVEGRITGAGGGWDWGPIRRFVGPNAPKRVQGGHCPDDTSMSKGLVRSVYLSQTEIAAASIVQTVPLVYYSGAYPTALLTDASAGPWLVNTTLFVNNPGTSALSNVAVRVEGSWGGANSTLIPSLPPGMSPVSVLMSVPVGAVSLWWTADTTPYMRRGQPQVLFTVNVSMTAPGTAPVLDSRSIGFRVFTLVTGDDSDPAALQGRDGSGNLTMRFKLNGADIFSRGADIIPMEFMEGRQSMLAYSRMLQSAVDGRFNTIRVDGIDAIFPDALYDLCDTLGLLVYHDMQYSQAQPLPQATLMQTSELRYQIGRLAPHPSLAVYDGCNECGGHGIYASFVMTIVAEADPSRPPWPSSPSEGWVTGVDRLWGLPNGSPLGLQPRATAQSAVQATRPQPSPARIECGDSCTVQVDADYCNTCVDAPHPAVSNASQCCALCTEAGPAACLAAVLFEGVCWFKPAANVTGHNPTYRAGVIAVWPAANGPIPPLPPPGPEPPGTRETHGPYTHGSGWPAVNGVADAIQPALPPTLFPSYSIGRNESGTFASEFGCTAFSSFESMSPTLSPAHWSVHGGSPPDVCTGSFFWQCVGGNAIAQRNYPADSLLSAYFGDAVARMDEVGELPFARQLYMSMLAQALDLASDIETRRSHNTWGTLIWQLNEIWPTGGWGTVEYGPGLGFTAGQVPGGRWKPIHHWLARHVFADVMQSCGGDGRCYIKNDDAVSVGGYPSIHYTRTLLRVADGSSATFGHMPAALSQGAGAILWTCLDGSAPVDGGMCVNSTAQVLESVGCAASGSDCVLLTSVVNAATGTPLSAHTQLLAAPGLLMPQLQYRDGLNVSLGAPAGDGSIPLFLSFLPPAPPSAVALLVVLTTSVHGRFSDNAFTLVQPAGAGAAQCRDPTQLCPARIAGMAGADTPTLFFIPWTTDPPATYMPALLATMRVQHLGLYA